jgi:DNA-binding HxlR family transcriptional regulator
MAAVGRRLRLLRAHGLIAKVSKTHRYVVTEKGRNVITALLAARQASTEKLTALAA